MKKLKFLLVVLVMSLMSTISFAQVEEVKTEVQEKAEVKVSDLPEAVTKTLADAFAGYEATKAFSSTLNGKVVYYISLTAEEKSTEVIVDAEGNVVGNTSEYDKK